MSCLRVHSPQGEIRLIDLGPANGCPARRHISGMVVVGVSGDAHARSVEYTRAWRERQREEKK